MSKRSIRLLVGIAIGAGFAYLSFRDARLSESIKSISEVSVPWMIAVLVFTYVALVLRSIRWGVLLSPVKKIGLGSLFTSLLIGYMTNNVLPLRAGEAIRAYHMGNREDVPKSTTLGSIVVERLLDLWTVVILLLISASFVAFSAQVRRVLLVGALVSLALLAVVYFISRRRDQLADWTGRILQKIVPKYAEKGGKIVRAFAEGVGLIKSPKRLVVLLILSVIIWLTSAAIVFCVSSATSIQLPPWGPLVVISIIALGITIPTVPGDIGTFQFFSILGLSLFGIGKETALTFSIVLHGSQYLPTTLTGLVLLWKESISLAGIRRVAWKEGTASSEE